MRKLVTVSLIVAIISTLSFCAWGVTRIAKKVQFDNNCEVYIKRASNTNDIEIAKEELQKAILYAEENGLTKGSVYISIYYPEETTSYPRNDIGFWYQNMKVAYDELDNLSENATQLDKSNVLMKVRERLTVNNEDGQLVRGPSGISIYPYNVTYFLWQAVSIILAIISWIWYVREKKSSY